MKNIRLPLAAFVAVIAVGILLVGAVAAAPAQDPPAKIYWCHTEPNGNSQTLYLPLQALQNAGHADANGNPLHAGDYAGACEDDPEPVLGCTDQAANNYDADATVDDGSCTYTIPGCTDSAANNYDPAANVDNGSCTYDTEGCMDEEATNYNPYATVDDGSCTYGEDVPGCTDPEANNYDQAATINDGSCTYDQPQFCDDRAALNYGAEAACLYKQPVCPEGSHMGDEGECVQTRSCPAYIAWLESFGIFDRLPPRCQNLPPKTGANDTVLNVWDQLITAPWWPFR